MKQMVKDVAAAQSLFKTWEVSSSIVSVTVQLHFTVSVGNRFCEFREDFLRAVQDLMKQARMFR